jgi:FkbM family methyltransferase
MMTIYASADWTAISLNRNTIQRAYEPVQIYFFTQLADWMAARSFFDVGANIGSFTVAMAKLQNMKHIHTFEPMPTLYADLAENARSNDPSGKIRLHNLAISEITGFVDFAVMGNYSGANGVATTLMHDSDTISHKITVPTSTLDEVVLTAAGTIDGPCFIKIDVEGHELEVLKGARSLLQRPCVLQIEMYDQGTKSKAINALMQELGYRCFFKIGADNYFAKVEMCPTDSQLLDVVSRAHSAMIADFQVVNLSSFGQEDNQQGTAIMRRFGPVQIRLFDPIARWLRTALGRR